MKFVRNLLAVLAVLLTALFLLAALAPSSLKPESKELLDAAIKPGVKITVLLLEDNHDLSSSRIRVDLTIKEIVRLKEIVNEHYFQGWYGLELAEGGMSHAIIFQNSDGSRLILKLGFKSHKAQINNDPEFEMPPTWIWKLRDLVLETGMPMNAGLAEQLSK